MVTTTILLALAATTVFGAPNGRDWGWKGPPQCPYDQKKCPDGSSPQCPPGLGECFNYAKCRDGVTDAPCTFDGVPPPTAQYGGSQAPPSYGEQPSDYAPQPAYPNAPNSPQYGGQPSYQKAPEPYAPPQPPQYGGQTSPYDPYQKAPEAYTPSQSNSYGYCPAACNTYSNRCDQTTAPTCIFPNPNVQRPRAACACRAGYKADGVADNDRTKQWRLPVEGQEHRVWVAEGVRCDTLCQNPYGPGGCREVVEIGAECIGGA
jgi:hypothetical protein